MGEIAASVAYATKGAKGLMAATLAFGCTSAAPVNEYRALKEQDQINQTHKAGMIFATNSYVAMNCEYVDAGTPIEITEDIADQPYLVRFKYSRAGVSKELYGLREEFGQNVAPVAPAAAPVSDRVKEIRAGVQRIKKKWGLPGTTFVSPGDP